MFVCMMYFCDLKTLLNVQRLKEHLSSYILNKQTSNFVNHFNETLHKFPDATNTTIIHIHPKESNRTS